jgi:hypothetical protein
MVQWGSIPHTTYLPRACAVRRSGRQSLSKADLIVAGSNRRVGWRGGEQQRVRDRDRTGREETRHCLSSLHLLLLTLCVPPVQGMGDSKANR